MKGFGNMTRKEFEKKWDEYLLEVLGFIVGREAIVPSTINCYQGTDEWIIRSIGERQSINIRFKGDEETVFNELNDMVESSYERKKELGLL